MVRRAAAERPDTPDQAASATRPQPSRPPLEVLRHPRRNSIRPRRGRIGEDEHRVSGRRRWGQPQGARPLAAAAPVGEHRLACCRRGVPDVAPSYGGGTSIGDLHSGEQSRVVCRVDAIVEVGIDTTPHCQIDLESGGVARESYQEDRHICGPSDDAARAKSGGGSVVRRSEPGSRLRDVVRVAGDSQGRMHEADPRPHPVGGQRLSSWSCLPLREPKGAGPPHSLAAPRRRASLARRITASTLLALRALWRRHASWQIARSSSETHRHGALRRFRARVQRLAALGRPRRAGPRVVVGGPGAPTTDLGPLLRQS